MADKCWAQCGSEGNHPEWGPHWWPCGTMKSSSIRGEGCYETEIVRKDAWIEKAKVALSWWVDVAGIEKIAGHLIKVTKDLLSEMEAR